MDHDLSGHLSPAKVAAFTREKAAAVSMQPRIFTFDP